MAVTTDIGEYRIVRPLGKGGMAAVYEVEHTRLGLHRAMKVFVAEGARADFLRSRFVAEGKLLARLDHPRLVKVHDFGVDEASGSPTMRFFPENCMIGSPSFNSRNESCFSAVEPVIGRNQWV